MTGTAPASGGTDLAANVASGSAPSGRVKVGPGRPLPPGMLPPPSPMVQRLRERLGSTGR
ncbi:hypothetical protein [Amycolatopsis samaneae]|uniref:Uncharacterized protein n=1 Tax=Amycolatopsis samaneae TaxID=664691 RepID=A0ABW5GXM3_9PSEU